MQKKQRRNSEGRLTSANLQYNTITSVSALREMG